MDFKFVLLVLGAWRSEKVIQTETPAKNSKQCGETPRAGLGLSASGRPGAAQAGAVPP